MLSESPDKLKAKVAQRVAWTGEVVTVTESVAWLIDAFIWCIVDHPERVDQIESAMNEVPKSLLVAVQERLAENRRPTGRWSFPLSRGLGTYSDNEAVPPVHDFHREALPGEQEAADLVAEWVSKRLN
jgi:hypothetical protein